MKRGLLATALVLSSCGATPNLPSGDKAFDLLSYGPRVLVLGSTLVITGDGFRAGESMEVQLLGDIKPAGGGPLARMDVTLVPTLADLGVLHVRIDESVLSAAGGGGEFKGRLLVRTQRDGGRYEGGFDATLTFARELEPALEPFEAAAIYFGDVVELRGSGFLLGGAEGDFELVANGTFLPDPGQGDAATLSDYLLDIRVEERTRALYVHTTELFGLRTGTFTGTLQPRNVHVMGATREGPAIDVTLDVLPSSLAAFSPPAASRMQRVLVAGNGFWESATDGVTTRLRFDGTFTDSNGVSSAVQEDVSIKPRSTSQATWVLAPREEDDAFVGLGSKPGVFQGTVTPVLDGLTNELPGLGWSGAFEVLPTKQVVHLKFTPQFPEALRQFGLRNLDRHVRERILEVARRDYARWNLDFREDEPEDFEHWTTIELTGDDPNEANLFGLDNSEGKDVGNRRLDDYVGGRNAAQLAVGTFAYGGVFLSSFLMFSPNICRELDEGTGLQTFRACRDGSGFDIATPRFDSIFKDFAPLLGGTEARLEEWETGARSQKVREAVRVLGNLAGNTAVHELGHSLGLAQETGLDPFHNAGDLPGYIMNPGPARTFEERAELDGMGPAEWAPGDAAYLDEVLPRM